VSEGLKPGWRRWRFEQMATNVNERVDDPSEAGVDYYLGLEHLDSDSLKIRRWGSPEDVSATKLLFQPGDIIFGRRRAYQRKLGVAEWRGIASAHSRVLRAKPDVVLPEFLPFFMQSDLFMDRAQRISVGSLSPTINWKTLAKEEFALPPLEEQKRTAFALSRLGTLRESLLDGIQRCGMLSVPFIEWAAGIAEKETLRSALRGEKKATPTGFSLFRVQELGSNDRQCVQVGPFGGSVASKHFADDGVPLMKINNITRQGSLDMSQCVRLRSTQAHQLEERYSVKTGDLVTASQATIGRTALVPDSIVSALIVPIPPIDVQDEILRSISENYLAEVALSDRLQRCEGLMRLSLKEAGL
jgi:hypothetical protein